MALWLETEEEGAAGSGRGALPNLTSLVYPDVAQLAHCRARSRERKRAGGWINTE